MSQKTWIDEELKEEIERFRQKCERSLGKPVTFTKASKLFADMWRTYTAPRTFVIVGKQKKKKKTWYDDGLNFLNP